MTSDVSLDQANAIIRAALDEASKRKLKPITVAVLDRGAHLVGLARQDGSSNLRPQIAIAKASGALALGVSSRTIGEMAVERPVFVSAVAGLAPGGMIPAAGGIIITDAAGNATGAVGVTGDTSDEDEACALAGIVTTARAVRV